MINRYMKCLSCFIRGNINGRYGSRLREVLNIYPRHLTVLSQENGLYSTSYDSDTTNSFLFYYDKYMWLNFSLSNEMLTTIINYFCYKKNEYSEIQYIKALLNESTNVFPSNFRIKTISKDLINFTKQMFALSDSQLSSHKIKLFNTLLNDDFKEEITDRLRKRLHVITCILNYRSQIVEIPPSSNITQKVVVNETDSDAILTQFAELRDTIDSLDLMIQ